MADPGDLRSEAAEAALWLRSRLGPPGAGVVLGSGFGALAEALGAGDAVPLGELPGSPVPRDRAGRVGVSVARRSAGSVWVFDGRLHLYEGYGARQVAFPIALLAAAGARALMLTCAAGGLLESDRPGDFALIADHLNLTGADPTRALARAAEATTFTDLQEAYDPDLAARWRSLAQERGMRLRNGILAALAGPSYETPAEVRMLRALGGDLVSMSTVPEAIAARYLGLRVCALACVANLGAGTRRGQPIDHRAVLGTVAEAVRREEAFLTGGIDLVLSSAT